MTPLPLSRTLRCLPAVLWVLVAACSETAPPAAPAADTEPIGRSGVIVAMGDSLTEGYGLEADRTYPAQLQNRLREDGFDYEVVNAGVSGETSSGALSRLDWVLTLEPDIVILATGGNDGLRGIDPAVTRKNVDAIVTRLEAEDVTVVLAGMKMFRNLGRQFVDAFDGLYPDIAESHGVVFVPFLLEGVATRASLNQADGIHPNAQGYARIVDTLYPFVEEAIRRHEGG
jgi:acyl-CoA thioesterase-1